MTAKEYLSQAYRIDQRINSKIEQISSLHDLATKATQTLSDMPGSATRNAHRMEDVIIKIIDFEVPDQQCTESRRTDLVGTALSLFQNVGANCC